MRLQRLVTRIYTGMLLTGCTMLAIFAAQVMAQSKPGDTQRGRMLYETHCVACHSTQAHWRDKHLVKSQADLLAQVTKWQKIAGQSWSSDEIEDTAAYLNEAFYQMK